MLRRSRAAGPRQTSLWMLLNDQWLSLITWLVLKTWLGRISVVKRVYVLTMVWQNYDLKDPKGAVLMCWNSKWFDRVFRYGIPWGSPFGGCLLEFHPIDCMQMHYCSIVYEALMPQWVDWTAHICAYFTVPRIHLIINLYILTRHGWIGDDSTNSIAPFSNVLIEVLLIQHRWLTCVLVEAFYCHAGIFEYCHELNIVYRDLKPVPCLGNCSCAAIGKSLEFPTFLGNLPGTLVESWMELMLCMQYYIVTIGMSIHHIAIFLFEVCLNFTESPVKVLVPACFNTDIPTWYNLGSSWRIPYCAVCVLQSMGHCQIYKIDTIFVSPTVMIVSLGGGFKYFLFSPLFGEDFQFD